MKILIKKTILFLVAIAMIANPYLGFLQPKRVTATTEEAETISEEEYKNEGPSDDSSLENGDPVKPFENESEQIIAQGMMGLLDRYSEENSLVDLDDLLGSPTNAKLVLNPTDLDSLKAMHCIANSVAAPNFEENPTEIYNHVDHQTQINLKQAINAGLPDYIRTMIDVAETDSHFAEQSMEVARNRLNYIPMVESYFYSLRFGNSETDLETRESNRQYYYALVKEARNNYGDKWKDNLTDKLDLAEGNSAALASILPTVQCLSGFTNAQLRTMMRTDRERKALVERVRHIVDNFVFIDTRVLKTLVYLITPKNQGGAGHHRIKVKKILQSAGAPLSNESQAILESYSNQVSCDGMTAAECGQAQRDGGADAIAEDENGEESDVYLVSEPPEINVSAHTSGQAIDISEIDDIRCTVVKKRRVGGWKNQAKPATPIKLAWQTTDGYNKTKPSTATDINGLLRDAAAESVGELIEELGRDVTDYEGDLSQSNLNDVIGVVGKSLIAEIFNSSSGNFGGHNLESTTSNLGSVYFADYFGLPRQLFVNHFIESVDDLYRVIGQAAIEKRANLPFGSLNSKDPIQASETYNLESTILNAGQRKLEYELGLESGDLSIEGFINTPEKPLPLNTIYQRIGSRLIENKIGLEKGALNSTEFASSDTLNQLSSKIGKYRSDLLMATPQYLDNLLHIPLGTTEKLKKGTLTPTAYLALVGEKRYDDTVSGFRHFSINNTAYQLPLTSQFSAGVGNQTMSSWEAAILGNKAAIETVGIYLLARSFGTTKYSSQVQPKSGEVAKPADGDIGLEAMRQWLKGNINNINTKIPDSIKIDVIINYLDQSTNLPTREELLPGVEIAENKFLQMGLEKGDIFRMFGHANATGRSVYERIGSKLFYYAVANKLANREDERVKIDLLDQNPEFRSDNPTINFYLSRITRINELVRKINSDWEGESSPEYKEIKDTLNLILSKLSIDRMLNITSIVDTCQEITTQLDRLKSLLEQKRREGVGDLGKINTTIRDVNEVIRLASEILAGREIPAAETLTIDQIKISSFQDTNARGQNGKSNKNKITPFLINDLIQGDISPSQFFLLIGTGKIEENLELPVNSLVYYIENVERRGLMGLDAFYIAVGQARIEEEIGITSPFYFQGYIVPELSKIPNFNRDLNALAEWYARYQKNKQPDLFASFDANQAKAYLQGLKTSSPIDYQSALRHVTEYWKANRAEMLNERGGRVFADKDVNDLIDNLVERKYASNEIAAKADLLFKMGIPGNFDSLVQDNAFTWALGAESAANSLDQKLGLKPGSTRQLITGQFVPAASSTYRLNNDDKLRVNAGLKLPKEAIDIYLQIVNHELSFEDLTKLGLTTEYNSVNPYAIPASNEGDNCPVIYQMIEPDKENGKGKFVVNNKTLESNSYSYYDRKGRHSFKNQNEAERYANEHSEDKLNILELLSKALSETYGPILHGDFDLTEATATRISKFLQGQSNSVFSDNEWVILESIGGADSANQPSPEDIQRYLEQVATSDLHPEIVSGYVLKSLFSRISAEKPLENYKQAVGATEMEKIASWKLFSSLGLRVNNDSFGPQNLYEILNGNFSSLNRIGATWIDQHLGLPEGTLMAVWNAQSENILKCGLNQAGMSILGNVFGLESIELNGNLVENIGQAKIEEALGLPRGTFYGLNTEQIITQIQPINFALAFHIPVSKSVYSNQDTIFTDNKRLSKIFGPSYANYASGMGGRALLQEIQRYVSSMPILSNEAIQAIAELDNELLQQTLQFLKDISSFSVAPPDSASALDKKFYAEVVDFHNFLNQTDSLFNLPDDSTYYLLIGSTTPNDYTMRVGEKVALRTSLTRLSDILGLGDDKAEAAINLLTNFRNVLYCSSFRPGGGCNDGLYQNWSYIYSNADRLFSLNLDEKAGLEEGTIGKIISEPENAPIVLAEQAAKKLDAKLKRNPSTILSFTALYKKISSRHTAKDDASAQAETACIAAIYPNQEDKSIKNDYEMNLSIYNEPAVSQRQGESESDFRSRQIDQERRKFQAEQNLASLAGQIREGNQRIAQCKQVRRDDYMGKREDSFGRPTIDGTVDWAKDAIADEIRQTISNVSVNGENVGVDMPLEDVNKAIFAGDIRYFEIAALAMSANVVYIIDLNGNGSEKPVPAGMRLSYNDIGFGFHGNENADGAAVDTVTWAHMENDRGNFTPATSPDPSIGYSFGNICTGNNGLVGGSVGCITTNEYIASGGANQIRNHSNITTANINTIQAQYHFDPTATNADHNSINTYYSQVENNAFNSSSALQHHLQNKPTDPKDGGDPKEFEIWQTERNNLVNLEDLAWNKYTTLNQDRALAQDRSRQVFRESFEYRLMDAVFWKMDENVFPGFTQALLKGDAKTKQFALAVYFENGLKRGRLGPVKFDALPVDVFNAAQQTIALFNNEITFDQYIELGGFDLVSNYITKRANGLLEISLDQDVVKGLIVGIATQKWELDEGITGTAQGYTTTGGKNVPTLGVAVSNWAQEKIFLWADKKMGLPEGTSFKAFDLTIKAFRATRIAKEIKSVNGAIQSAAASADQAEWSSQAFAAGDESVSQADVMADEANSLATANTANNQITNASPEAKKILDQNGVAPIDTSTGKIEASSSDVAVNGSKAETNAIDGATKAQVAVVSFIVTTAIGKLFGEEIGKLEQKLGLTPGTGMILVGLAVEAGTTYLITSGAKLFVNPATAYIGVAMFIVLNLFGYYKIEYRCTADGYYPNIDQAPSDSTDDVAGIGVWDGTNSEMVQNRSIQAARYKAKRLLIDVLEMQNSPRFSDPDDPLIPVQVMTGRQEDVNDVSALISSNLCDKRFSNYANSLGICGEDNDIKSGIWANPQTVAWTHIGF